MTQITVNIVGGTEQENTTAVTVGTVRWGLNGTANFGQAQNVPEGHKPLVVYKTSAPTQISIMVEVQEIPTTLNITVNLNDIHVNPVPPPQILSIRPSFTTTRDNNQMKHRNIFAKAVTQTRFNVTNNTNGMLGNQYILVFITPVDQAQNWVYAAWQQLNPGEGGTMSFLLDQNVSGRMVSSDEFYTTNTVAIPPSYVSSLTNKNGLQPTLGPIELGSQVSPPTVTSQQSGIKNSTANPGSAMYAEWLLNGNLTVRSQTTISAGGTLSAFELNTSLYWAVGNFSQGPNYSYNQVTASQIYALPANTPEVDVSLTYNTATQQFQWSFTPPSSP